MCLAWNLIIFEQIFLHLWLHSQRFCFCFLFFFTTQENLPLFVCEKQIISYNHQASLICIYANAKQSKRTEHTWLQLNVANVSQRRAAASLAAVFRRASEAQETAGGSADARKARQHLLRSWLLSLDISCSLKFIFGGGGVLCMNGTACMPWYYHLRRKSSGLYSTNCNESGVCVDVTFKHRNSFRAAVEFFFFFFFYVCKRFLMVWKRKNKNKTSLCLNCQPLLWVSSAPRWRNSQRELLAWKSEANHKGVSHRSDPIWSLNVCFTWRR